MNGRLKEAKHLIKEPQPFCATYVNTIRNKNKMNRLKNLANNVEDLGGYTSKSFKSFARKFKNDFAKEVAKIGGHITDFNTGHYYVSGFIRIYHNKCYYFSISDIRHFDYGQMLYRTAKDEYDYTGGANRYVDIKTDMIYEMDLG